VVAIDGNPKVIATLTANLDKNLAVPHVVVQGVIGTEAGRMVTGTYAQQANLGSMTFSDSARQTGAEVGDAVEAAIATLEALRGAHGDYDVLKLDVEGCERDVLDSDAQWIREKKPIIWLECNEDNRVFRVLDFLRNAGYDVYYFAFPSFNPGNYNHNQELIFPVAFEVGLLAVPPATPVVFPEQLRVLGCLMARIGSNEDLRKQLWLTPRWGMADWNGMSRTQLLGLCSRYARKHDYGSFLRVEPNDESSSAV
jgi:FkbM family methyltransferase